MPRQDPWAYLETKPNRGVSRTVRGDFARVAFHYPRLGRCVELSVDTQGRFSVQVGPAPGVGGVEFETVHTGHVLTIREGGE